MAGAPWPAWNGENDGGIGEMTYDARTSFRRACMRARALRLQGRATSASALDEQESKKEAERQ